MGDTVRWLMFMYQVPSEPSRLRTAVWRRLKALGAVYVAHSVAALPESPEAERALRALRAEVGQMGGAAQLVRAEPLLGQGDFTARYNQARDEEYAEVIGRCADFLAEIARESGAGHFSYAELEENDEDLAKLRTWLGKVAARDVLGAASAESARAALAECEEALEGFAAQVYAADPESP
ncbi:MAG TPA: Chromate resistance protein ChrB [Trebonia sp.]|nr:Chromate resistance protein ChrB [Trebonia sp.]